MAYLKARILWQLFIQPLHGWLPYMMPTAPSFCIFEFYGVAVYVSTAPLAKLESFHNQFGCLAHFRLVVWLYEITSAC